MCFFLHTSFAIVFFFALSSLCSPLRMTAAAARRPQKKGDVAELDEKGVELWAKHVEPKNARAKESA